ncbi:pseudouridine synthase family protein [Wolffia australiana]
MSYPTPLTPPHPPQSKPAELRRAMSAASRSALFSLSPHHLAFQDDSLAVLHKPAGVYCESLLAAYAATSSPSSPPSDLHLANRLDRDTSGLMIITRSPLAAAKLAQDFAARRVRKSYVALCTSAVPPRWGRVRVVSGHGRSRFGAWRVYAAADVGRSLPGGSRVREMATRFELASPVGGREEEILAAEGNILPAAAAAAEILVRAWPETGRTHQIRLHCQFLGMPIVGDVKYGGVSERNGTECEFHALHAESLEFEHPVTGVPLRLRSPLPLWAAVRV